jgi:hypothetical protein
VCGGSQRGPVSRWLVREDAKRPHRERVSRPGTSSQRIPHCHVAGDPRGFETGIPELVGDRFEGDADRRQPIDLVLLKVELNRLRRGLLMMLEMIP